MHRVTQKSLDHFEMHIICHFLINFFFIINLSKIVMDKFTTEQQVQIIKL